MKENENLTNYMHGKLLVSKGVLQAELHYCTFLHEYLYFHL